MSRACGSLKKYLAPLPTEKEKSWKQYGRRVVGSVFKFNSNLITYVHKIYLTVTIIVNTLCVGIDVFFNTGDR